MNVAFVAFHGDVGPLEVQSCESTSINEEGFLTASACREADFDEELDAIYPLRSVIR